MKFRDCFIDEFGNIWKAKSLINESKDLPIVYFDICDVDLDTVIRWKLVNVRDYLNHYERVKNANLNNPIILRDDGYCMNGWHRIIKALFEGVEKLPAKRFLHNPKPDFKGEIK